MECFVRVTLAKSEEIGEPVCRSKSPLVSCGFERNLGEIARIRRSGHWMTKNVKIPVAVRVSETYKKGTFDFSPKQCVFRPSESGKIQAP